jgi:hypothetical protein
MIMGDKASDRYRVSGFDHGAPPLDDNKNKFINLNKFVIINALQKPADLRLDPRHSVSFGIDFGKPVYLAEPAPSEADVARVLESVRPNKI